VQEVHGPGGARKDRVADLGEDRGVARHDEVLIRGAAVAEVVAELDP
jgi:hypothetical protein